LSICGVCYSRLTTRPKTGAPTRNGLPTSCKSDAHKRRSLRETQCTELIRLPSERIAENALGARTGVPDRPALRDPVLHERQACWLDYTTGTEMVSHVKGMS